ncbi:hypothetical protein ABIE45_005785 [Methylobacterium sp. OAE515]
METRHWLMRRPYELDCLGHLFHCFESDRPSLSQSQHIET